MVDARWAGATCPERVQWPAAFQDLGTLPIPAVSSHFGLSIWLIASLETGMYSIFIVFCLVSLITNLSNLALVVTFHLFVFLSISGYHWTTWCYRCTNLFLFFVFGSWWVETCISFRILLTYAQSWSSAAMISARCELFCGWPWDSKSCVDGESSAWRCYGTTPFCSAQIYSRNE